MSVDEVDTLAGEPKGPVTDAAPAAEADENAQRRWVNGVRRAAGNRAAALVVVNVVFAVAVGLAYPHFLTWPNFSSMLVGNGLLFVLVAFMAVLLIGGVFDLSIDGVVNLAAVVAGLAVVHGDGIVVAIVAGLGVGLLAGAMNGLIITKLKVNPLMTTLGTWWVAQGIAYGLTGGVTPSGLGSSFDSIGSASPLGIAMTVWYPIILAPLVAVLLAKSRFGYHVYATGGDPEAARLRRVRVDRVVVAGFIMMGLASALTGIVLAANVDAASPTTVNGANLQVIAGAVIGGCSLRGGRGSVFGAVLGMFFLVMLNNATIVVGVNPYWQYTVLGAVVLGAVIIDALANRRAASNA